MAPVVENLSAVPREDVVAMARYLASLGAGPGSPGNITSTDRAVPGQNPHATGAQTATPPSDGPGARIYAAACASCHEGGRPAPFGGIHLSLSTAVKGESPENLVNVILEGLPAEDGVARPIMPGFAEVLTDRQLSDVVTYLRSRFDGSPPGRVSSRRSGMPGPRTRSRCDRRLRSNGEIRMTTLILNGESRTATSSPDTPLLYVLRDEFGLHAAKFGCGLGQCGACTVMLDGEAVFSCVTPIMLVENRRVTTLEGLGTADAPGILQRAFIDEQAAQCGFCIPGMMMRAQALLDRDPAASDAAIWTELEPQLCRCGTHMRILRAIRRAADALRTTKAASATGAAR